VCLSVCVCVSVRLYGSSPHVERTFYGSWHISWAIYIFSTHNAGACVLNVCVCVHSLIFKRIIAKFAGNIQLLTISVKDNVLCMFTHRAHACESTCAKACVIKPSLIYGPTLFKFAVNILQITTSSMGYVLFLFTHRARASARVRARVWFNSQLSLDGFSSNLMGTYYKWPHVT
jgi:hypothetical protein